MSITPSNTVRISSGRHRELRKICKANGHSMFWLLNYIIDLYFQLRTENADNAKIAIAKTEGKPKEKAPA